MKIITPFGPKIGKSKIPSNIVKRINNEIDQIVKNKNNLKKHDYSKKVVGQVYQEIQLSKKFVNKNLKIYINKSISDYLLEKKFLATVPGSAFGKNGEGFIRISYASNIKNLKKSILYLNDFIDE